MNGETYVGVFLTEERHYPKFLDALKNDVINKLNEKISLFIGTNIFNFKFEIETQSEYCDKISFEVNLKPNEDINDNRNYTAYYYNESGILSNGKLQKPKITVICPVMGGKTNYSTIAFCLSHELTHLYDDWFRLKNGKESISMAEINVSSNAFIQNIMRFGGNLYKGIGVLCYMSLKVERQAFLSQTVQELDGLECTPMNYKEKLKQTTFYGNLSKSYKMFKKGLSEATNGELWNLNVWIYQNFPKVKIPKCENKIFNYKTYRDKLNNWAENIYNQLMKRYYSVVSYYVDRKLRELCESNCLIKL